MKKTFLLTIVLSALFTIGAYAEEKTVASPDGRLVVTISNDDGKAFYSVSYDNKTMVERSQLGLKADIGDFANGLTLKSSNQKHVGDCYEMRTVKMSHINYEANQLNLDFVNRKQQAMTITFNVSDNNVAFRYSFPQQGDTACMVVTEEATSFSLPQQTTTFVCPQSEAMIGWMRTKPSYEEEYKADAPMTDKSKFGQGYTFPCLFHVGTDGWVLVSETGTNGAYVGCHLSDYDAQKGYTIAFPMPTEANGVGTTTAGMTLPGSTPWRTITVGSTLKPIVETTVQYDVVSPLYETTIQYRPGRYTWSWLIWQDKSVNYDDQVKFIDLAATMGYEYVLVDNYWDKQIGRQRMVELSRYAQSKGISLMLWYSSNGYENDAPQSPKNCMNTAIARKKEMAWLRSIGVKGIKVDFFGGDKQHTMQLYEDILSDANDYGLQVIFHGCTLPRGWERMYPNFVASEAVLASENVFFEEHHAQQEAFQLTLHPFCRNAVATMDWGGTIMNRYISKDNKSRHKRYTTDVFEMAVAIVAQSSIQCIALQPNNLTELPQFELDFLKDVPTTWDETLFIDGYPGKYVVMARRHGDKWYTVGLNATDKPMTFSIELPDRDAKTVDVYSDKTAKKGEMAESQLKSVKVDKNHKVKVTMQPNGGFIIK